MAPDSESSPASEASRSDTSPPPASTASAASSTTEQPCEESFRQTAFETILIAGGVVLFLAMLYEMHTPPREEVFLTPPLVGLAGVILLWPVRHYKTARALLLSGGLLLLLWTVSKVSRVLIPFGVVYLLAYLLNPLVERLEERYRVPRWLPALFVTALLGGVLALVVFILAPNVADQTQALSNRVLNAMRSLRTWLEASTLLDTLQEAALLQKEEVIAQIQTLIKEQAARLPQAIQDLVSSLDSVLGLLTLLALTPIIFFYTLRDYPTVQSALVDLFPTAGGHRNYIVKAGSIVGRYFRGQLLICLIAAFNVSVLLFLFDIPFWLLIGLLAGLLNLIPQIGALITMTIGALVALLLGSWTKAAIVILVLLGEGFLEQSVLTPNILSYQVGIHPLLVLFSLLVFGTLFGVLGLLIAVPVTTILLTGYRAFQEEFTLDLNEYGSS